MKTVFIYALCEPGTRTVRYIGKTNNPKKRLRQHLSGSIKTQTPLGNWLRGLLGVPPNLVLLSEVPESTGSAEEMRYVAAARTSLGMDLVNSTDGGDGSINPCPETRAKMSAAKRGVPLSPEHCAAMRGPKSPETRAAISNACKGIPKSPEHRAALSASRKGVTRGPYKKKTLTAKPI